MLDAAALRASTSAPGNCEDATSTILSETAWKIWRIDGTFVRTLPGLTAYWSAAFSPDGQYLVGGRAGVAGNTTATASVFRVSDGALVHALNPGETNNFYIAYGVDYSPNGGIVALAYNGYRGVELYDRATGILLRTIGDSGYAAKFSPDGQTLAATRTNFVGLWRISDGALLRTFTVGTLLSFSADGQLLAIAEEQAAGVVHVCRTADGDLAALLAAFGTNCP